MTGMPSASLPSTSLFGEKKPATLVQEFVVTTRKDLASPTGEAGQAKFLTTTISVPPGHEPGVIERPRITPESKRRHFVIVGQRKLDEAQFNSEIAAQVSGRVGVSRDVLVFIHGFNTGYDEARFRLAQIVTDSGFTGVPVLFTWPSRNQFLAYGSDRESATASRDALEKLLRDLGQTPGVGRVHVLAHSMGTFLAMEALRQNAIAGYPNLNGKLGDVMLAAPDIDLDVFRSQLARIGKAAQISVFAAADDRALSLSSTLAGDRQRVGALNLDDPKQREEIARLGVRVYDLTASKGADLFRHGTFAEAPQVVRAIGAQLAEPRVEDRQAQAYVDEEAIKLTLTQPPATPPAGSVSTSPLAPLPDATGTASQPKL
jgi:esterase/lipase superfamily enzyme